MRTLILLLAVLLSGCERGISNGSDVRKLWEHCENAGYGKCTMTAIPNGWLADYDKFVEKKRAEE